VFISDCAKVSAFLQNVNACADARGFGYLARMSRKTIVIVILLAVVSLGLIVAGQVYWVRKAYSIQEQQFNDRVVMALTRVVGEILIMNKDSAVTEPVLQKQANFFVANINETPEPYLLETLLREEFERSNLTEDFEYGIYDCFTDSIAFGGKVDFGNPFTGRAVQIQELINLEPDGHYFGVLFPNKTALILRQLDFWMYSSIIIFFIVVFFSYTILLLLRQKRLSEVKTDFINNMTHELKTPISTIALSAEALSSPDIAKQPDRLTQYVQIIRNENNRLRSQVEKVLQIASLSPGRVRVKNELIDVHAVIRKAEGTFRIKLEEQEGHLALDLQAPNPGIRGDQLHVTNMIYNLLDNAVKYSGENPQVTVRTNNADGKLLVSISDNGIGIPKAYQKMIFDKFYRVPTGNRHDVKGFGLGLFYVRTMMKAHGGRVWVESAPGKGSTFILEFNTV
jgi:two-component system phosphate regulon sensor histidine kinase PhoR